MKYLARPLSVLGFLAIGVFAVEKESAPVGITGVEIHKNGTKIFLTVYPASPIDGYSSFVYDETSNADVSDFFKLLQAQALTAKSLGGQNVSIRYNNQTLSGIKIIN